MGSWNGTKLGIRVKPELNEEAEQLMIILGVNLGEEIIEEVGDLGKDYNPSIEGEVVGFFSAKVYGVMPALENYFSSYQNKFDYYYEEDEEDEELDDNCHTLDDLFLFINRVFPSTSLFLVHEEGNNTSDSYYRYEAIYDPSKKMKTIRNCYYCFDEQINCSTDNPRKEGTTVEVGKIAGNEPKKDDIEWLMKKAEAKNYSQLVQRLRACLG